MDVSSLLVNTNSLIQTNMDSTVVFPPIPSVHVTWPQVFMYFLTLLPVLVPVLFTMLKTSRMEKVQKSNSDKLDCNTETTTKSAAELKVVHEKVDGKMEDLIKASIKAALAEGKLSATQDAQAKSEFALANQAIGVANANVANANVATVVPVQATPIIPV